MKYDEISNGISIFTGTIALANIQEILSIIILVLSILNILINMGIKIYGKIKNKKYDEISKDITKAIDDLKELEKEGKKDVK